VGSWRIGGKVLDYLKQLRFRRINLFFGGGFSLFLQYVILFILLSYSYLNVVPLFGSSYSGYFFIDFNLGRLLFSIFLLAFLLILIPKKIERFSQLFVVFLFLTLFPSFMVLYSCGGASVIFLFFLSACFALLGWMLNARFFRAKLVFKGFCRCQLALILCLIVVFAVYGLFLFKSGFSHMNYSFRVEKLYSNRAFVDSHIFNGPWAYLISWFGKVCNIFLIIYFLHRKKYLSSLLFIAMQIIFASIVSEKTYFLLGFMAVFFYCFLRYSRKRHIFLVVFSNLLVILSLAMFYLRGSIFLQNFFVRRVFLDTANMIYLYYDYFSRHSLLLWSKSVPGSALPLTNFIASIYLKDPAQSANAGFFGTSYASFGFPGMIISVLLLGCLLKFIDAIVDKNLPVCFASACLIPSFWSLSSSGMMTSFFTHGIFLAIFLLTLFACRKSQKDYS
jgi:hypothetical protein